MLSPLVLGMWGGRLLARRLPRYRTVLRCTCSTLGLGSHLVLAESFATFGLASLSWLDRLLFLMPVFVLMHVPRWRTTWLRLRGEVEEAERADRTKCAQSTDELASLLHDTVGQGLAVIALQARNAAKAEDHHQLQVIDEIATHTMTELRKVMGRLNDVPPGGAGVVDETLLDVVERFRTAGLRLEFLARGSDEQLPARLRGVVVRVAREALTNALKHAPGAHVSVEFRAGPKVRLTVRTRHTGFAKSAGGLGPGPWAGGRGSRIMHRLVAQHGGQLQVGHVPHGYTVAISLPLEHCHAEPPALASGGSR